MGHPYFVHSAQPLARGLRHRSLGMCLHDSRSGTREGLGIRRSGQFVRKRLNNISHRISQVLQYCNYGLSWPSGRILKRDLRRDFSEFLNSRVDIGYDVFTCEVLLHNFWGNISDVDFRLPSRITNDYRPMLIEDVHLVNDENFGVERGVLVIWLKIFNEF